MDQFRTQNISFSIQIFLFSFTIFFVSTLISFYLILNSFAQIRVKIKYVPPRDAVLRYKILFQNKITCNYKLFTWIIYLTIIEILHAAKKKFSWLHVVLVSDIVTLSCQWHIISENEDSVENEASLAIFHRQQIQTQFSISNDNCKHIQK